MAVSLLAHDVSDLCLGKPPLRTLSASSTVAEALSALRRSSRDSSNCFLSVWSCSCDHSHRRVHPKADHHVDVGSRRCVGKVCMSDVVCFLSGEDNLKNPSRALQQPLSALLPKASPALVSHLEPHASLLEAIDLILEGAQNLVIPIHSHLSRKKPMHKTSPNTTLHKNGEYCWLTQEDIIRYLLNAIGLFSPITNYTIESLNIIDQSICAVRYDDPASSALPLIQQSLVKQTSVAILDVEDRLVGEISLLALNFCNESVAAAIATLSAGELMAYIECGDPAEDLIRLVKERLEERNLRGALVLMEDESGISSGLSSSSYSSSSDEEFGLGRSSRYSGHSMRGLRSTEVIVCHPWSSLVAVMIQALSHRLSYVWVVEEDGTLVGVVTFAGMLKVFRERLKAMV